MQKRRYSYFASDFHLGLDLEISSLNREKIIVEWLHSIRHEARAIFLVGDIFDYWYEYKTVIPKHSIYLLGVLADLQSDGIEIHYFKGNHDMWVYDFFENDLGFHVHDRHFEIEIDQKRFYITHGDELGKNEWSYQITKAIFRNRIARICFSLFHPSIGLRLMRYISRRSRMRSAKKDYSIQEIETSIKSQHDQTPFDFFIFGHIHQPMIQTLTGSDSKYCNLGDWMKHFTYAVWNGENLELRSHTTRPS